MDIQTPRTSKRLAAQKAKEFIKKIDSPCDEDSVSESNVATSGDDQDSNDEVTDVPSDPDDPLSVKRAKGRQGNREQARKTRLLRFWNEFWEQPELRQGVPYPAQQAKSMLAKHKHLKCPQCPTTFSTRQGLQYHYKRCNIDLKPRCLVCQLTFLTKGELLRHLCINHRADLPSPPSNLVVGLEYLFNPETNRRASGPRASSSIRNAFTSAKSFQTNHFSQSCPEFVKWMPNKRSWSPLDQHTGSFTVLPETESPKFKMNDGEWNSLNVGQSFSVENKDHDRISLINPPNDIVFYAGGSIWAAAWCPTPNDFSNKNPEVNLSQYIALAVSCADMDTTRTFQDNSSEPGHIQIWSITPVKTQDKHEFESSSCCAKLEFSIYHQYGCIWDMVWCPGGTSYQEPNPHCHNDSQMPRLGLLALACGDGKIRVISMPHVQYLTANHTSAGMSDRSPIFTVQSVADLIHPGVGPSTDYHTIVCKSLSWNQINRGLIAAGYSNGMIAVFDLNTSSPLLVTNQDVRQMFRPLKSWFAHAMAVTSLSWIPSENMNSLASGSTDRTIKFWNVDDLISFLTIEKFPVTKLIFDHRHKGFVAAFDTAFNASFINRVLTRLPTKDGWEGRSLSLHRGTVWDADISQVTSSFASVDSAGEVIMLPMFSSKKIRSSIVIQAHYRHSIYRLAPCALDDKPVDLQANKVDENETLNQPTGEKLPETLDSSAESVDLDDSGQDSSDSSIDDSTDDVLRATRTPKELETRKTSRPKRFLLSQNHPPIDTYRDFKNTLGIQFIDSRFEQSGPVLNNFIESSRRAKDIELLNCDRVSDYPFCSVNKVIWSPNLTKFSLLLTATHIGLCRVSDLKLVEQAIESF